MSLNTQRYISKDLVHFVGRNAANDDERFLLLSHIIRSGLISHPPHSQNIRGNLHVNPDAKISDNEMYNPQITCFADIPHGDLAIHINKYKGFGISFSKHFIAQNGGRPVFYIPKDSLIDKVPIGDYFDEKVKLYHEVFEDIREARKAENEFRLKQENLEQGFKDRQDRMDSQRESRRKESSLQEFINFQIFSYIKFFDNSKEDNDVDNFYFEREWRKVGNIEFLITDIRTVFIPELYALQFKHSFPSYNGQVIFTDRL